MGEKVPDIEQRVAFAMVARSPIDRLVAAKQARGWAKPDGLFAAMDLGTWGQNVLLAMWSSITRRNRVVMLVFCPKRNFSHDSWSHRVSFVLWRAPDAATDRIA